ncbi:MAG: hypothetical protein A2X61_16735 [Ignavibacteria bacterium GWB2_35_12]|nr:MAG: hypothetical protein A2X63_13180 [Ignavibacteria bacterium GWA2_35_8]OGU38003.1 MAG: hypothetical protein A2X61_16735 [Ignavibacteria bacterium GWB2_35_12]OGU95689.1 MAG: hypothetical protein A2220_04385 [Ignavibacteria bacterium RIFOXYA2_FULL_35_10]OGV25076.1 MAG: hypothetical protein A2475_16895 [Ignavibacteria bacterium RIFOXYC2_FULL_35_21]
MENLLINEIIKELLSDLKQKYPDFNGIYLFGSRVRSDFHIDSDYDIAILFDRIVNQRFKDEVIDIIYNYILEFDIFIDVHIFNSQDIINPLTPFRTNIKKEGVFYEV